MLGTCWRAEYILSCPSLSRGVISDIKTEVQGHLKSYLRNSYSNFSQNYLPLLILELLVGISSKEIIESYWVFLFPSGRET